MLAVSAAHQYSSIIISRDHYRRPIPDDYFRGNYGECATRASRTSMSVVFKSGNWLNCRQLSDDHHS